MTREDAIRRIVRGTAEVIDHEGLARKLALGAERRRPLRVKAGFDPTAPDLHLGHWVLLRKLRQFQDLGHQVYFLIGDFTARIGDPTGRNKLRPRMEDAEIRANAETYAGQVFKVLDPRRTEVVFNSAWLEGLGTRRVLELAACCSVAQILARADFKARFEGGREITVLEFFYPLLQGYDSVHLKADVEVGGSDQKFNLLMGRQLQERFGQDPQAVVLTPLLEGLDGVRKMSKSFGNAVALQDPPEEMFGKIMSVSDALMERYYEVLTDVDLETVRSLHPKEAKLRLAEEITAALHSPSAASKAREGFERVFSRGDAPEEMPEFPAGPEVVEVLVSGGLVASRNEARRLIRQGAVVFDGRRIEDEHWCPAPGVLRVGKRRYLRIVPSEK